MIYIYASTDGGVPSNMGLGALNPSSCFITEDLNGKFELYMTHPIDDEGKWERIEQGRIIKAPTHRGVQLFRIYNVFKDPINQKSYVVQARHIFYDLLDNFLEDVRPTVKDGQEAGDIILAGYQHATDFVFSSDITDISTAYYIRENPVAALIGGIDQSFINRWGGEIERDNYDIAINTRIGADNGVKIAYRKNLTGLEITVDTSPVVTRVMPTALDENGVVITTDQKYYDSPYIGNYPHPKYGVLNTGIRVGQEVDGSVPYPDVATAKAAMATMALAYFANGADQPQTTLNVSYIDLGQTDEYAEYANLFSVSLGDDVTVYYPPIDIDIKTRVISMQWDAVLDRPYAATLGNLEPNIAKTVVDNDIDMSALKASVATALQENERYNGVYVNHTDGFKTIATIDGHTITTKQNSYDGFAIYDGNDYVGGIKVMDGKAVLVSNILTNDIGGESYAVIGDVDISGVTNRGILIYNKNVSETEPTLKIVTGKSTLADGTFGGFLRIITYNGAELWMGRSNTLTFRMIDHTGHPRCAVDYLKTQILSPNGNALGITDDGAYKIISGTETPL